MSIEIEAKAKVVSSLEGQRMKLKLQIDTRRLELSRLEDKQKVEKKMLHELTEAIRFINSDTGN